MRTYSEGTDLPLPSWAKLLNDPMQRKVQARAQNSLDEALKNHRLRKGKGRCEIESDWHCAVDQCSSSQETYTAEAFLDHLRDLHHYPEDYLTQMSRCLKEADDIEREEIEREEIEREEIEREEIEREEIEREEIEREEIEREEIEREEIEREEKQREELGGCGRDGRDSNNKRCFVEEEGSNGSSSDSSSGCIPGPSKRARVLSLPVRESQIGALNYKRQRTLT
ncbi:hypothetical protein B0J14DRAFT_59164 [Halenospora varia]|nr:hypothetical protein B0J14DRAFT_59164 [Halenospora varia]